MTPWMAVTVMSRSSTSALIDTFITLASTVIRNCASARIPRTSRPPPPSAAVVVAVIPRPSHASGRSWRLAGPRRRPRPRRGRPVRRAAHRRRQPAPLLVPAAHGAHRGRGGLGLGVAGPKLADDLERALPAGKAGLGLLAQAGPGIRARAPPGPVGGAHPGQVGAGGRGAPARETAGGAKAGQEAGGQVPAGPGAHEL